MKYLAYFQAYSNTYGELTRLMAKYEEALAIDGVLGLVIGTRPDCMPDELLDYLEELNRRCLLLVEYGIESTCDEILKAVNRGHDYACVCDAVKRTASRGIATGGHIILGHAENPSAANYQAYADGCGIQRASRAFPSLQRGGIYRQCDRFFGELASDACL